MRDIVLATLFFGALPYALVHPVWGVYLWTWISVMNPHRLTWGFAYDFPFAMLSALVTFIGVLVTKDRRRLPVAPESVLLVLFLIWTTIGYPLALFPGDAYEMWSKVIKVQIMTLAAAALLVERVQIKQFMWVLVVSLGFYGVKGGIFTILAAGGERVYGPAGSFIEGNNEIALALIVVIPLMWYLFEVTKNRWVRAGLIAAMALSALAALGSHSRGALLAIAAMSIAIWWYSKRKALLGLGLLTLAPLMLLFMPEKWDERMMTISNYEQDPSAMGRINAWYMAWNLAKDRPLFGGGFDVWQPGAFRQYAPNPTDVHAAHSIFFQVLGEHGFIGFALYMGVWWFTWRTATWIRKHTAPDGDSRWAFHLAAMSQVSLVGFFVGGAFLSLAYFDLPYYVMASLMATKWILKQEQRQTSPTARDLGPSVATARAATGDIPHQTTRHGA